MLSLITVLTIPSPSQGTWEIGPFPLRGYALCIIAGIIVAIWIGERRWVARGGTAGEVSDLAVWAVPFGLVGGRLYHVMTDWQLYFGEGKNPVTALYIWRGGLGVWGAIAHGRARCRHRRAAARHQAAAGARRDGARGADRPGAWAAGATGSTRSSSAGRPTCRGRWRSTRRTDPSGYLDSADVPPDVPLRVPLVRGCLRRRRLGRSALPPRPRPGGGALRDDLHRSAASGSSGCASTTSSSPTSSGCGSTSGPRSCCSCWPTAYFVWAGRTRPGREETVYLRERRRPRPRPESAD